MRWKVNLANPAVIGVEYRQIRMSMHLNDLRHRSRQCVIVSDCLRHRLNYLFKNTRISRL